MGEELGDARAQEEPVDRRADVFALLRAEDARSFRQLYNGVVRKKIKKYVGKLLKNIPIRLLDEHGSDQLLGFLAQETTGKLPWMKFEIDVAIANFLKTLSN